MMEQWRMAILGLAEISTNCGKTLRAIVRIRIKRHTKLSVIPAPLLGEKQ